VVDTLETLPYASSPPKGGPRTGSPLQTCGPLNVPAGCSRQPLSITNQIGQLTCDDSRTLVRCGGRWRMARRFRGMNRSPLLQGGKCGLHERLGSRPGWPWWARWRWPEGPRQRRSNTTFHDEFSDVAEDFCEVPGLTVQFDFVADGRLLAIPHGPDGLVYFHVNVRFTAVYTNVANGNTVTEVGNAVDKDLRVTDNGDGTLTILVLNTGNGVLYGADGKAIGRNPGQVRFEFVVDHAGTPTDPSDDVDIEGSFRVVKGSTGRSDDFCETIVSALQA
jgi:hypothetical protein